MIYDHKTFQNAYYYTRSINCFSIFLYMWCVCVLLKQKNLIDFMEHIHFYGKIIMLKIVKWSLMEQFMKRKIFITIACGIINICWKYNIFLIIIWDDCNVDIIRQNQQWWLLLDFFSFHNIIRTLFFLCVVFFH